MRRNLSQKRILVTGASSGIGRALAIRLVAKGARVLATARRLEKLEQLREEANRGVRAGEEGAGLQVLAGDLTEGATRERLMEVVDQRWGGVVDGVVNNAGAGAVGPFVEATPERLMQVLQLDLVAPLELTRLAYPRLKRGEQPFVMMVGSVLGHRAVPWKSEYCAAKFGLRGFTESLRLEWRREGIDVMHVSPSTTDSEFFDSLLESNGGKRRRSRLAMSPDTVAGTIVRLMQGRKRDRVLSWGGKVLVHMGYLFPGLMDRVLVYTPKPGGTSEGSGEASPKGASL